MNKRFINIATWFSLILLFFLLVNFKNSKKAVQRCIGVQVLIDETDGTQFLSKEDVLRRIALEHDVVVGLKLDSIHLAEIEEAIYSIPQTKTAKVYLNIDGVLNVKIKQRKAISRVLNNNGGGYYIDEEGALMPLSNNYSAKVLVITGALPSYNQIEKLRGDSALNNPWVELQNELYELSKIVCENPFWKAQIQQAYVDENKHVTLIPRVGNHIIELGKCVLLETKFKKLRIFYEKGIPYTSWRAYSKINLEYKNQVVCTKKSGYE